MLTSPEDTSKPLLVVVAGPTASGKTGVAIQLAKHFQTSILSADSRQCYQELNIGVAKPTPSELVKARHYFINTNSIHQPIDAAGYADFGLSVLDGLFKGKNIAIAVGGTGLYIKALCEGVDDIPAIPESVRLKVNALYQTVGIAGLQEKLKLVDPVYFADGEIKNPQRVMRAIEVCLHTGKSIRYFQQGSAKPRPFRVCYLGMDVPREKLHQNINTRVDEMMQAGLLKEVEQLIPFRTLNALQTVGYTELFDYFAGETSLHEAIERIKIHTRQYAKRQNTWFKKVPGMNWLAPEHLEEMKRKIAECLNI